MRYERTIQLQFWRFLAFLIIFQYHASQWTFYQIDTAKGLVDWVDTLSQVKYWIVPDHFNSNELFPAFDGRKKNNETVLISIYYGLIPNSLFFSSDGIISVTVIYRSMTLCLYKASANL